jgi:hypothetical protein
MDMSLIIRLFYRNGTAPLGAAVPGLVHGGGESINNLQSTGFIDDGRINHQSTVILLLQLWAVTGAFPVAVNWERQAPFFTRASAQ